MLEVLNRIAYRFLSVQISHTAILALERVVYNMDSRNYTSKQ